MHVLVICRNNPFITPAGTEIYTRDLIIELKRQGHHVTVLHGTESINNASSQSRAPCRRYSIKLRIKIPYIRALEYYIRCRNLCKDLLKDNVIDVVLGMGAGTYYGSILKPIKPDNQKLFVYYAIDCMVSEYLRKKSSIRSRELIYRIKNWLWYRIMILSDKISCQVSDLILSSSKDTAKNLKKYYKVPSKKIKVLYFGIADNFTEGIHINEQKDILFLHIATDPERKGTSYFLKALNTLYKKYKTEAKAIIAGTNNPFYINLAKELRVDAEFLGRIPHEKLKWLYASCTCLVVPSLSEGFCLPVIEAAVFGKPSIVTNIGSLPELVSNGLDGYIVPPADSKRLAEKISLIINHVKLRKKMSIEAKKKAHKFKISEVAHKMIHLLRQYLRTKSLHF